MNKPTVMIIDDDLVVRTLLKKELSDLYKVIGFSYIENALSLIKQNTCSVVLLDIDFGNRMDGLTGLKKLLNIDSEISVLMISSVTPIETIVETIKNGAIDFIEKPIDLKKIKFRIKKALDLKEMKHISDCYMDLRERDDLKYTIIGKSPELLKVKKEIEMAGPMRLLLVGETGVGKTPFAKYSNKLLSLEDCKNRPFEQINCACLKHERFVDELFGHVKGAYTGAVSDKKGLVELAIGGDLFLDEIGDLDLECQAELLTFLDNYEYYKLGGTKKHASEVRIISATNRDLKEMLANGKFRKDLYSRIAGCVVYIPPLRERKEDISELILHFTTFFSGCKKDISEKIIEHLKKFDWEEGNVRDLRNVCEYMCISSRNSKSIEAIHLPESYAILESNIKQVASIEGIDTSSIFKKGYDEFLEAFEYSVLLKLLKKESCIKSLANMMKINRMTLNRKLIKLNLK